MRSARASQPALPWPREQVSRTQPVLEPFDPGVDRQSLPKQTETVAPLPTGIKVGTASGASQGKGLDTIGAEMHALLQ